VQVLTIDFETYYSQEFSLTKMTTEEYVRSGEFEVIGVSVQVDDGEPVWFSGDMPSTEDWLKQFDWERSFALAHNAAFDGAILTWLFDIKPRGWLDTLSMGRALHGTDVGGSLAVLAQHYGLGEKGTEVVNAKGLRRLDFPSDQLARYGEYCKNDVALTYALFERMAQEFPMSELKLIDLTLRMFTEPMLDINVSLLLDHLTQLQQQKQKLLDAVTMVDKGQIMSNQKLAATLKLCGIDPPMKVSPTTGRETFAFSKTDEGFLALLGHEDPRVQALVAARLGVKSTLEETRTQRFIEIAARGLLPVPLRYYAAHTGRWGGDDKVNLHNLPRGSELKKAIIAPNNHVFIDSDSSQIEARTLAWLAGQDDLVAAFEKGEDVYKIMASAIYGKPVADIEKNERFMGKTTILGSGYSMGAVKFRAQLKVSKVIITEDEAEHIITTYRKTYPKIVEFWKAANSALKAVLEDKFMAFGRGDLLRVEGKKGIRLPNGLYLRYPNLRQVQDPETGNNQYVYDSKKGKQVVETKIYGGKVTENVCQALARIIIGEQMLMIAKKYKVVMTVHDAIGCIAPVEQEENAKEYVELCMRLRPSWAPELPLNCEAGSGKSYGDC
jgi:DNA polymerase I-like protein with 3'-5' exonuclease and polymerase domains